MLIKKKNKPPVLKLSLNWKKKLKKCSSGGPAETLLSTWRGYEWAQAVLSPGWIRHSCYWLLHSPARRGSAGGAACLSSPRAPPRLGNPTGWWGRAPRRWYRDTAEIFPAHTRTASLNVTYWVFRCLIVIWPPAASRGACCFWDLLWLKCSYLYFLLKSLFTGLKPHEVWFSAKMQFGF